MTYNGLAVTLTPAQMSAWKTSAYGQRGGAHKFLDDLVAGAVVPLRTETYSLCSTRVRLRLHVPIDRIDVVKAMAGEQGLSCAALVRAALFGDENSSAPGLSSVGSADASFSIRLTASQAAAIRTSTYGRFGGRRRFVEDLVAGTLNPMTADGGPLTALFSIDLNRKTVAELDALVPSGTTRSAWIRRQAFTPSHP